MFRARKPSVQRTPSGKHNPGEVPLIKQEPRAALGHDTKPEAPLPPLSDDIKRPETTSSCPQLPLLPLPQTRDHHKIDLSQVRQPLHDTDADVRRWEKRNAYTPWCDADDEEDLTREVRKDRKIAPERDPLFAQIFAMFPEEGAAQ